jgi:hypothetical protein
MHQLRQLKYWCGCVLFNMDNCNRDAEIVAEAARGRKRGRGVAEEDSDNDDDEEEYAGSNKRSITQPPKKGRTNAEEEWHEKKKKKKNRKVTTEARARIADGERGEFGGVMRALALNMKADTALKNQKLKALTQGARGRDRNSPRLRAEDNDPERYDYDDYHDFDEDEEDDDY